MNKPATKTKKTLKSNETRDRKGAGSGHGLCASTYTDGSEGIKKTLHMIFQGLTTFKITLGNGSQTLDYAVPN